MHHDLGSDLSHTVIGAAIEVHRELGPGLLETIYEKCLIHELDHRGITCARQVQVPLVYKQTPLNSHLRIDLLVDNSLIVEIKSVDRLTPLHDAQALTYLRLTGLQLALLINFNAVLLRHGIRRLALSSAPSAPLR